MKKLLFVAFATSLAISPAGIQAQPDGIIVSSGRSIADFVVDVSRDIDWQINRFGVTSSRQQETGMAQVFFECGPDGKPINIKMYYMSGPGIGMTARRAVSKIRSLHPLPQGVAHDQLYLANVIVAQDLGQFEELAKELKQREKQRVASTKGGRKIFAFSVSKSPST